MEGDTVVMSEIFRFKETGTDPEGRVLGEIRPTGLRPMFGHQLEAAGFKLPPEMFGADALTLRSPQGRR